MCCNEKPILQCSVWVAKNLKALQRKDQQGLVNDWQQGANEIKVMMRFEACGPGGQWNQWLRYIDLGN